MIRFELKNGWDQSHYLHTEYLISLLIVWTRSQSVETTEMLLSTILKARFGFSKRSPQGRIESREIAVGGCKLIPFLNSKWEEQKALQCHETNQLELTRWNTRKSHSVRDRYLESLHFTFCTRSTNRHANEFIWSLLQSVFGLASSWSWFIIIIRSIRLYHLSISTPPFLSLSLSHTLRDEFQ